MGVLKHIVIAGFDGALATAITGLMDIFSLTGVSWQRISGESPAPRFRVWLASDGKNPVQCLNGLELKAHLSFQDVIGHNDSEALPDWQSEPDANALWAIIVPTIGNRLDTALSENTRLLDLLKWGHQKQLLLAANCTGTFFLAEAGLLEQCQATTHWGYQKEFEERYPNVRLDIEQLITQAGNIFCAGGGLSWFDLAVYLIEKELGYDAALQVAKAFVIDYRRESQLTYSLSQLSHKHQDALVARVQGYLSEHIQDDLDLDGLADIFNISSRTLIRRFKAALRVTPGAYIQQLRIEKAQKQLAETALTPTQIIHHLGYEDLSSFRRLFKRQTGLTLAQYRQRYAKRL